MTTMPITSVSPSILKKSSSVIWWAILQFLLLVIGAYWCNQMHVTRSNMRRYTHGEMLFAEVNSLASDECLLPLNYYSLPYCRPLGVIKLGQLLMGERTQYSPYMFQMNTNNSHYLCTSHPLSQQEVEILKQTIKDNYQVNLELDHLPAVNPGYKQSPHLWKGAPIGYTRVSDDRSYIFNHLKFRVLVHELRSSFSTEEMTDPVSYEIVGFEVIPCSFKREPEAMSKLKMYDYVSPSVCRWESDGYQEIKENEQVTFTYEVEFAMSEKRWSSRWEAYMQMEGARVHWFSILSSVGTVFLVALCLLIEISMTVDRDLSGDDEEEQPLLKQGIARWKPVIADAFKEPSCSKLLCILVGNGIQIAGMAIVTVTCAALGVMLPTRGMHLTGMIVLYLLFGFAAGYVAVWLCRTIKGCSEGWMLVSLSTGCFFFAIALSIFTVLNIIYYANGSTGFIPLSAYLTLLPLWFCVSIPLTLLGGFAGSRSCELIEYPVKTNQDPIEIKVRESRRSWLLVLLSGALPFGTILVELSLILSSFWLDRSYHDFGFLLLVVVLLVIICAQVSGGQTYRSLCNEDWNWWWKAFFASGSAGFYVFVYSVLYLVFDLEGLNGPASVAVYLGYSMILALTVVLSTGAIGFLITFCLLRYLASI